MADLKTRYNETLARYRKAEVWLDNPDISLEEKEKQVNRFTAILDEMNGLYRQIGTMTRDEILNGFPEVTK